MATKPVRIQRKRTKGSGMPKNAVYVGRPTRFGNPFYIIPGETNGAVLAVERYRLWITQGIHNSLFAFRLPPISQEIALLRGKDLACWCSLDQPCHADVLLELANQ